MEASTAGRQLPPGVALDAHGEPTTDPLAVLSGGALLPFDRSHKGSGLGLMVELLAGSLAGAAVLDKAAARDWGNLIVALDPEILGPANEFKARVDTVLSRVKSAPTQPGVASLQLPGERGDALAAQRLREGVLPIEANLWAELQRMAAQGEAFGDPPTHVEGQTLPRRPSRARADGKGLRMATRLVHCDSAVTDPYAGER